jgi:hypothetical protein
MLVPVTKGGVHQAGYRGGQGDDVAGGVDEGECVFHDAFLSLGA